MSSNLTRSANLDSGPTDLNHFSSLFRFFSLHRLVFAEQAQAFIINGVIKGKVCRMETQSRRLFIKQVAGFSLLSAGGLSGCAAKAIAQDYSKSEVIVSEGKEPSVFTKIIRGEIPCFKVFEDRYTFAFFPREQLNVGHTLVVPKIQVDSFLDVPEPYHAAIFQNAQKIGRAILSSTKCARVGSLIHGFEVPHFHYHLIPMFSSKDIWTIHPTKHSESELLEMQKKIVAALV